MQGQGGLCIPAVRGKRQCGRLRGRRSVFEPWLYPEINSVVLGKSLFFSKLSFLSSKMGMVTTVLYLCLKETGKLSWGRACETLWTEKCSCLSARTSASQPGGSGLAVSLDTAADTQLSRAEGHGSHSI